MEDGKIRLGEDRKEELNTILSLIDKYRIETDTDAKNHLIKMLAVRHIVTKGLLTEEMKGMIHEDDISSVIIVPEPFEKVNFEELDVPVMVTTPPDLSTAWEEPLSNLTNSAAGK